MKKILVRAFIIINLLLVFSCSNFEKSNTEKSSYELPSIERPERKLNVAFVIVDGVYNSELTAPMDIFHHTIFHDKYGMEVFTVAPSMDQITTFEGLKILPDYSFRNKNMPEIDILVVPSAEHSMDSDLQNSNLINFISEKGEKAKFIMSLCDGAFVLAKAGLLNGFESTTFPADIGKFREMFPELVVHEGVSFVHHGKVITSAGGAKSFDPALYLSELLYGIESARGIAEGMVIDWDLNTIKHEIISN